MSDPLPGGHYKAAFSIVLRLAILEGAIRGFFLPLRSTSDVPVARIVKSLSNAELRSGGESLVGQ